MTDVKRAKAVTTVRVNYKKWLIIKLHILTGYTRNSRANIHSLANQIGGKRFALTPLADELVEVFGDMNIVSGLFYTFAVVPFWQWGKVFRGFKGVIDD